MSINIFMKTFKMRRYHYGVFKLFVGKMEFFSLIRLVYIYLFLDCRMEIVCSTNLFLLVVRILDRLKLERKFFLYSFL